MENDRIKVIVAHPGKQHSFRLATALNRNNMLEAYITTVYNKKSSIGMKTLKKILPYKEAKKTEGRRCKELSDNVVVQFYSILSLVTLLLLRIDKKRKVYYHWNGFVSYLFGIRSAKYIIKKMLVW